ncbi:MAG: hypothetical protein LAO31_19725 [Acidobacteriia bacterium]|nr:hypothetical protein [Terriglobia bacterium]
MDSMAAIQAAGSIATAVGVWFAFRQLRMTKQQAVASFENQLNHRYREIAEQLPVDLLLGGSLSEEDIKRHLKYFYQYIDLTNEEIFLRKNDRISDSTWESWREGIEWTLSLPTFKSAWETIKRQLPDGFQELRRLENENFRRNPKDWK